ncbi:hypothetical protein HK098_007595 [Nowakowskiella sp. JEL0407]|nr:hypothetical protein HK098_007595 [Nowakowskiella sp. JEL0407]
MTGLGKKSLLCRSDEFDSEVDAKENAAHLAKEILMTDAQKKSIQQKRQLNITVPAAAPQNTQQRNRSIVPEETNGIVPQDGNSGLSNQDSTVALTAPGTDRSNTN